MDTKTRDRAVTAPTSLQQAYGYCTALVRGADPDRYIASLYAPETVRPGLFALYAFSHEIARVREQVSEPLPGEVRLQWWRDVLDGTGAEAGRSHPVALALLDTVKRFHLPLAPLSSLVDARVFDLYDDPMPTLGDLEGYAGETASALVRLAGLVLAQGRDPGGAAAAGQAGVAYALAGLMRAFPWHAARGQLYLPADLLGRNGVTRDDIVRGRGGPGVLYALKELRAVTRDHLARVRDLRATIPQAIAPAFLPVALVEAYLRRMDRPDYDPFRTMVTLPAWRRQWLIWRAARQAMRR